jgi:signal transduction histidine kinase
VARDIHDVLAHSLGGLVIQLDAVDALLDAGRTADAQARARDARQLAASGLEEARRAVGALHEPRESTEPGEQLQAALEGLVTAHRALGGRIDFATVGTPRALPAEEAHALRRAAQEALTNARKHAVGEPVTTELRWTSDAVELEIANPIGIRSQRAALPISGRHGLTGMAERFAGLDGATLAAGAHEDRFVVEARVTTS